MEQDEYSTEIRIEVTREMLKEALGEVEEDALVTIQHWESMTNQLFHALVTMYPEKILCH